ncbi:GntR family transcriptional regulator [Pseudogemmobacter blasticus]|uniref:GntR family transcriptional regulator n=1 Tax=Fuscovulum blasticum DSM 2131 TaxID=1188250 RepID=A0A2T4JFH5_FUSBL|nr:GntR family transcriptional regulator [Fuscovulum blasticum]AWD23462.1 GntR family transcriptional regulator [Fuscovulum blasticum]PTE16669.1 GntR family transcriptional regulator [Fuscovulum blasticum DSM 2131]
MTDTGEGAYPERKRGSGVKVVYEMLRDEILDLKLPPGSPIDEVHLAERFGMSRTPIREALVRLAGEGLVETLPNRSAMVSNIDVLNLHTFYDAITLMYRVTTRLAAQYHRPADLSRIRGLQQMYAAAAAAQDALAMVAVNRDLHAAIAEAGRNPYFTTLTLRLLDEGRRILRLYYQSFDDRLPKQYVDEHEAMIAAIAARDIDLCDRLARAHADQIVRQIQQLFARDERQEIAL